MTVTKQRIRDKFGAKSSVQDSFLEKIIGAVLLDLMGVQEAG
jgi:hypothetical protein